MNILIIEDERLAAEKLSKMITSIDPSFHIAGITGSIDSSVTWLKNHPLPDLIMADVELEDGQCFEIFNRVMINTPVIFTTSYNEYAIKAFKLNGIDYLLKPVKKEALSAAFDKLKQLKELYSDYKVLPVDFKKMLLEIHAETKRRDFRQRFLVKHGQRLVSVETDDIAFFYTDEKLSFFKTNSNKKYIVEYTMDELEEFVNPVKFFRINRQFLIAIYSIEDIHNYFNSRLLLHLKPSVDKEVIISRDRVNDFKEWMGR